jgi:hypothetical protein
MPSIEQVKEKWSHDNLVPITDWKFETDGYRNFIDINGNLI